MLKGVASAARQIAGATKIGIGIAASAAFGKLHIRSATTGTSSVSANADELVLENSGNTGVTLLCGDSSEASVDFAANIATPVRGRVVYSFATAILSFFANGAVRLNIDSSGHTYPAANGTQNLGGASNRWGTVFAATDVINTSDARLKTAVRPLDAAELAAAKAMSAEIGTFRFLEAIVTKGDAARHHAGLTVQRAIEIMEQHDLDPFAYGFICYDEWPARDAAGSVPARAAGNAYSFRTAELLLFLARGFDARLTAAGL